MKSVCLELWDLSSVLNLLHSGKIQLLLREIAAANVKGPHINTTIITSIPKGLQGTGCILAGLMCYRKDCKGLREQYNIRRRWAIGERTNSHRPASR